jgi:hypothetical protein
MAEAVYTVELEAEHDEIQAVALRADVRGPRGELLRDGTLVTFTIEGDGVFEPDSLVQTTIIKTTGGAATVAWLPHPLHEPGSPFKGLVTASCPEAAWMKISRFDVTEEPSEASNHEGGKA